MAGGSFYAAAGDAMRSQVTRRKCAQVADRIASAARGIASAEGVEVAVGREDGTRPKGRPFSRVTVGSAAEFGDQFKPRRRILARAASASARTGRR